MPLWWPLFRTDKNWWWTKGTDTCFIFFPIISEMIRLVIRGLPFFMSGRIWEDSWGVRGFFVKIERIFIPPKKFQNIFVPPPSKNPLTPYPSYKREALLSSVFWFNLLFSDSIFSLNSCDRYHNVRVLIRKKLISLCVNITIKMNLVLVKSSWWLDKISARYWGRIFSKNSYFKVTLTSPTCCYFKAFLSVVIRTHR